MHIAVKWEIFGWFSGLLLASQGHQLGESCELGASDLRRREEKSKMFLMSLTDWLIDWSIELEQGGFAIIIKDLLSII